MCISCCLSVLLSAPYHHVCARFAIAPGETRTQAARAGQVRGGVCVCVCACSYCQSVPSIRHLSYVFCGAWLNKNAPSGFVGVREGCGGEEPSHRLSIVSSAQGRADSSVHIHVCARCAVGEAPSLPLLLGVVTSAGVVQVVGACRFVG